MASNRRNKFPKTSCGIFSNRNAIAVVLSLVSMGANAQDICSVEGKSRLRSANVTDAQIGKICSSQSAYTATAPTGYRDVKSAIFDGKNAVGKTIQFDATHRELGFSRGRPKILIKVDTDTDLSLWNVYFDGSFNGRVQELRPGQRLKITCRILELSGLVSDCELIQLSDLR